MFASFSGDFIETSAASVTCAATHLSTEPVYMQPMPHNVETPDQRMVPRAEKVISIWMTIVVKPLLQDDH